MKSIIRTFVTSFILLINLCGQWKIVNEGPIDTAEFVSLQDICFVSKNIGFMTAITGYEGRSHPIGNVFQTMDGGITWGIIPFPDVNPKTVNFPDSLRGYIVGRSSTYTTKDGGQTWDNSGYPFQDMFFVNNRIGYGARENELFRSENGGKTWENVTSYKVCPTEDRDRCFLKSLYFIDENEGWGVGDDGLIIKYTYKFWERFNAGTNLPLNKVFFANADTGWIAGGFRNDDEKIESIFIRTIDEGKSWDKVTGMNYLVHDLYFENTQLGWATGEDETGYGVLLKSTDGGQSWNEELDSLPGVLRTLYFRDNTGWAIGDTGLILINNPTYTSLAESKSSPYFNKIRLKNYPNPFRMKTIISYRLPVIGKIEVNIYDFTGRKISTLINETHPAGSYKVKWNAVGFKPGIYFCELRTEQSRLVQKMVLLE